MNAPKVSVCVNTYNQEGYIRRSLQSIIDQEVRFEFEVIVGDDCSTDKSRDIVLEFARKYPDKVRYYFQERNTGGTKNYIDIHALARGEYIAHLDGDDLMLPNKLQRQVDYLDAHPGCTIVWHSVIRFADHEESLLKDCSYQSKQVEKYQLCDLMLYGPLGNHSSSMYRNGTRNTRTGDSAVLDWMFYTDSLSKGYGALLHEVLGGYRVNNRNSLGSGKNVNRVKKVMAKHFNEAASLYPSCRKELCIGAIIRAMIEAKRNWGLFVDFLLIAINNISWVSPWEIYRVRNEGKRLLGIRFHNVSEFDLSSSNNSRISV